MEARMDTKGIIIEAMRKLLAERGFHKITVQDILDAAHCSRGTFYRHFRDKYDIMNYFYLQIGKEILSDPEMDGKAKTEAILDAVLTHRDYFRGVVGTEGANSFKTFVAICAKRFYLSIYRQKEGHRAAIPEEIDFMADFLAGGCSSTIEKWIIGGERLSKSELADCLYQMTPEIFR